MGRIRDSSTFAARQRSEIGRYEVPTEVSLPVFGIAMFPLVVHQPASLASSAVTPVGCVHKSRGDNVVRMRVQFKRCVSRVWMFQRGHSVDGCVLASI